MTCPRCGGLGYTSAPYMWPDLFTITACTCDAGRRMVDEIQRSANHGGEDCRGFIKKENGE